MELYTKVSYENSRSLTLRYSTSFGISSRLFTNDIRDSIYAIYALARIGDEVVDTYKGSDSLALLDQLESDVYSSMKSGYSTNPVIHAFVDTARKYKITKTLIKPFFKSMRMDLKPREYDSRQYKEYIHGSAEVIGLMCLRVFVDGDDALYEDLKPGAMALGSAYQKVNFLRDLAADYKELGRLYFPGLTFEGFDEDSKHEVIKDIRNDFSDASTALEKLPANSRKATSLSYKYYSELLDRLENTPAKVIKQNRIRVPSYRKTALLATTLMKGN